jgi:hypothetical protein
LDAKRTWPDPLPARRLDPVARDPQQTSLGYDLHVANAAKFSNEISVELAAHIQQNLVCGFTSKGRFIGTTFDKSCEDGIGYLAPLQPVRITRSVEIFMVVEGGIDYFRREPWDGCKCS